MRKYIILIIALMFAFPTSAMAHAINAPDISHVAVHHHYRRPHIVRRWIPTAKCESTLHWHENIGLFDGGLQFLPSTWLAHRPGFFPRYAYKATKRQQVRVANRLLRGATLDPWPNCPTPGNRFP